MNGQCHMVINAIESKSPFVTLHMNVSISMAVEKNNNIKLVKNVVKLMDDVFFWLIKLWMKWKNCKKNCFSFQLFWSLNKLFYGYGYADYITKSIELRMVRTFCIRKYASINCIN